MDAISEFGSGLLTFLQGMPAAAWTLAAGVLVAVIGIGGNALVARGKEKRAYSRAREDDLERRRRESYIEVLSLANDLHWNTNLDRVTIHEQENRTLDQRLASTEVLSTKLTNLNNAIVRASIDSDVAMRLHLEMLWRAANYESNREVGAEKVTREEFGTHFPTLSEAINRFEQAVHEVFAPGWTLPSINTIDALDSFISELKQTDSTTEGDPEPNPKPQ